MEVESKNFVLEYTVPGWGELEKDPGYIHSFHPNIRTSGPQGESQVGVGSHCSVTAVEVELMKDYEQVVMKYANDSYFHSSVADSG